MVGRQHSTSGVITDSYSFHCFFSSRSLSMYISTSICAQTVRKLFVCIHLHLAFSAFFDVEHITSAKRMRANISSAATRVAPGFRQSIASINLGPANSFSNRTPKRFLFLPRYTTAYTGWSRKVVGKRGRFEIFNVRRSTRVREI